MENDKRRLSYLTSEIEAVYHEAALKSGLSDSALRILYTVCLQGDGCMLQEVVRLTGTSKQTINSALRKLEERGILYLKSAEGNRKNVYLTERGRELSEKSAMRILDIENDVLSSWTQAERESYLELTEKFLNSMREKLKEKW